jgi:16S rRNA G966 N2-methylase RsmD
MSYLQSTFLNASGLNSVISDGCDLKTAFSRVLNYFDPNKNRNKKTKVLDNSFSPIWSDKDTKLFEINRSKNLTGSVTDNIYDIVIYEPPRNKNFYNDATESSKVFNKIIKTDGILIIKMNDFKEKGSRELRGSFEIWDIFNEAGYYLYDNVVYNFFKSSNNCETTDRSEIVHLYFMVFKKK